jgi:putative transposase
MQVINMAYKFRIYPNAEQKILLAKHFGSCRFVWNYFLNQRKEYYINNKENIEAKRIKGCLNYYDNSKDLTKLKKQDGFQWLNECNAQSLQATLKHLDSSYKMFFRKTHQFPKFKNKNNKQSFTIPQFFKLENNKIYFPKFKNGIKVKEHRKLDGKFVVATISKNCNNQYYVSIIVEKEVKTLDNLQKAIGIDLGIKDFATCSNGVVYENIKPLKRKMKKLKYLQRQLSKSNKSSGIRKKRQLKLAKYHLKISNIRKDYLHKITNQISNENQIICLEDLAVSNMIKNHKLAQAISDVSWHEFKRQLKYKCKWKGRQLVIIDRFFPSSRMCDVCGTINQSLTLKDREWTCDNCETTHNRDLLASRNILRQGLNIAAGMVVKSEGSCCQ